ncbi:Phage integrase, N-terminal SAM-like domain [Abditibacterium utsteinense]|uniref:Phage integrase, N-terminal SAM-like domain n=1 Tax=Abditibacterium utsteinense TaxID=1960156 RepID=A0A2S8SV13_9BACT|nr:phage integrase N-terminal SAM-like domain-containing protein [Abditibacterium utsteinense]PQV64630.1 Phage integrase, N-terminal SAM-like domain [Abditibacterium utsteinense]
MLDSPLEFTNSGIARRDAQRIPIAVLERLTQDYLLDCQHRLQQPTTSATRRIFINNLLWFLRHKELDACGPHELKQFFVYLQNGHEGSGGRWGNPQRTRAVRPISIKDYFANLRIMFRWFVEDEALWNSP